MALKAWAMQASAGKKARRRSLSIERMWQNLQVTAQCQLRQL
jgi:hypothetical protein